MCKHRWVKMYDAFSYKSRMLFCWECDAEMIIPIEEEGEYPYPHEISTPTGE